MKQSLGVIVARMQVDILHAGHIHLIESVTAENDAVLVLLGERDKVPGAKHPLPAPLRAQMVHEHFPSILVGTLKDTPSNERWSAELDRTVNEIAHDAEVTLYCSRDGFAPYYSGAFPVKEIDPVAAPSGTEIRHRIKVEGVETTNADYRRGWIAHATRRYPVDLSTVDVAVMDGAREFIWLGQKPEDCGKWRFVGGFVDPSDETRKAAALRETKEEFGELNLSNPVHIGDFKIDDMRYRDEADGTRTDFFLVTNSWKAPTANDDISAVKCFRIEDLIDNLIDAHQILGAALLDHLNQS